MAALFYCFGTIFEWAAVRIGCGEQLHISRATYYLEQQRALETLTGILQAWQERASGCGAHRGAFKA